MLRGLGIELRAHIDNPVWQGFFDFVFFASSTLLPIFFGAALGNVIRGVPLGPDGYFFEPLWTNFRAGPHPGILDWYTVMAGVVALVTLTIHGALYIAVKTEGDLAERSRKLAVGLWPALLALTCISLAATCYVRPQVMNNYREHPLGLLVPVVVLGSLILIIWGARKNNNLTNNNNNEKLAFVGSSLYITAMLVGAVFALYPLVLPASTDPAYSLTIYNSTAGHHGLVVGVIWWLPGMALTTGYFVFIYRMFRGKVRREGGGY
jgi:cytochrome d ubiquinol oxidase subunit II